MNNSTISENHEVIEPPAPSGDRSVHETLVGLRPALEKAKAQIQAIASEAMVRGVYFDEFSDEKKSIDEMQRVIAEELKMKLVVDTEIINLSSSDAEVMATVYLLSPKGYLPFISRSGETKKVESHLPFAHKHLQAAETLAVIKVLGAIGLLDKELVEFEESEMESIQNDKSHVQELIEPEVDQTELESVIPSKEKGQSDAKADAKKKAGDAKAKADADAKKKADDAKAKPTESEQSEAPAKRGGKGKTAKRRVARSGRRAALSAIINETPTAELVEEKPEEKVEEKSEPSKPVEKGVKEEAQEQKPVSKVEPTVKTTQKRPVSKRRKLTLNDKTKLDEPVKADPEAKADVQSKIAGTSPVETELSRQEMIDSVRGVAEENEIPVSVIISDALNRDATQFDDASDKEIGYIYNKYVLNMGDEL